MQPKQNDMMQGWVVTYIGNGDSLGNGSIAKILQHVLDQQRALSNSLVHVHNVVVVRLEANGGSFGSGHFDGCVA